MAAVAAAADSASFVEVQKFGLAEIVTAAAVEHCQKKKDFVLAVVFAAFAAAA